MENVYNHDRPLSDFQDNIDTLKANGFNPIAVSQMTLEDVYVFETKEEALEGYIRFERDENKNWIGAIVGWWYGKEDFLNAVKEYEEKSEIKVLIHWL